jgi:hypothetical protein
MLFQRTDDYDFRTWNSLLDFPQRCRRRDIMSAPRDYPEIPFTCLARTLMQISGKSFPNPIQLRSPCLIIGISGKGPLRGIAKQIDSASGGVITRLQKRGDLKGDWAQTLLLPALTGIAAERVLLRRRISQIRASGTRCIDRTESRRSTLAGRRYRCQWPR